MSTLDEIRDQKGYWTPVIKKSKILYVEGPMGSRYFPSTIDDCASLNEIFPKTNKGDLPLKIIVGGLAVLLTGVIIYAIARDITSAKRVEDALSKYKTTKEVNASDYGESYWKISEAFYPQNFNRQTETGHLMKLNNAKSPTLHENEKVKVPIYEK